MIGLVALATAAVAAQAETLQVGFGNDRPPYVMAARHSGLEVEIVTRAAALAGMQVLAVFSGNERALRMLHAGTLDAVTGTRPEGGDCRWYSRPYLAYQDVAITLQQRHLVLQRVEDLAGHGVVSFQRAHRLLGPAFAAMAARNPGYREYADEMTLPMLLFTGQTDVVVGDRRIFNYFVRRLPHVSRLDVGQPVQIVALWPPLPFSVGFREQTQRDRFDRGLQILRQRGEYAALLKKYAGIENR